MCCCTVVVPYEDPVHTANGRRFFAVVMMHCVYAMFLRLGFRTFVQIITNSLPTLWRMQFTSELVAKYKSTPESTSDNALMCRFAWHLDIAKCTLHQRWRSAFFFCMGRRFENRTPHTHAHTHNELNSELERLTGKRANLRAGGRAGKRTNL